MECVRSRKTPNASIEAGYSHSIALCMNVAAIQTGRRSPSTTRPSRSWLEARSMRKLLLLGFLAAGFELGGSTFAKAAGQGCSGRRR